MKARMPQEKDEGGRMSPRLAAGSRCPTKPNSAIAVGQGVDGGCRFCRGWLRQFVGLLGSGSLWWLAAANADAMHARLPLKIMIKRRRLLIEQFPLRQNMRESS